MKQEIFSLAAGDVVLQWPSAMTAEEYADFKDWLELIIRKAERAIQIHSFTSEADPEAV